MKNVKSRRPRDEKPRIVKVRSQDNKSKPKGPKPEGGGGDEWSTQPPRKKKKKKPFENAPKAKRNKKRR
jgi:ribonuclease R